MALRIAVYSDVVGVSAVPPVARATLAAVLLFGAVGFGLVRLALPETLRRHELLWILPTGAVAVAFAMTPLGYLGVPFVANLALVAAAGLALSAFAWRTQGAPRRPDLSAIGWPVYLGLLLLAIALVPMFRAGFATVIGNGGDAHMAAGTAELLRHTWPGGIDAALPIDQEWSLWQSKHPIYYALAAVSAIAGLETYETLSIVGALVLALATTGIYLIAREILGAGVAVASVAMLLAGLGRMAIHTAIHPYFNQVWGYLMVPFAIVLAWAVMRSPSRRGLALLGLFVAVGTMAYPLAAPIPVGVIAVMWWLDRRARGESWSAPRRVRWATYGAAALALFVVGVAAGVMEKLYDGWLVLIHPSRSLSAWGGDLATWFPDQWFFSISIDAGWPVALAIIVAFCLWELRRLPRPVAAGLAALFALAAVFAVSMRLRDGGWYFHFKILAFVAPLVVVCAAAGMARVRKIGPALLVFWTLMAITGARDEVASTYDQLPRTVTVLQDWAARLPADASIRLDMEPDTQDWVSYMLATRRVCSQRPLDDTYYPHVPVSRRADYVLVRRMAVPFDAVGPPLMRNEEFALYRMRGDVPGEDRCSQRMVQRV